FIPPPHPTPTLFPYTTLFRSSALGEQLVHLAHRHRREGAREAGRRPRRESEARGIGEALVRQAMIGEGEDEPVLVLDHRGGRIEDRKSTRLNSSHVEISYAVF